MYKIINNFYIETGYNFNLATSTVTTIVEAFLWEIGMIA